MEKEVRETITKRTTEELLEAVSENPDEYSEEAIAYMTDTLMQRGAPAAEIEKRKMRYRQKLIELKQWKEKAREDKKWVIAAVISPKETAIYYERRSFSPMVNDNSIRAVSKGMVDGASVDGLIWDYYNDRAPELVKNTKIIYKSPRYGIPPVVVHPRTPAHVKGKLKKIFLEMHEDPVGKKILSEIRIERFIVPEDSSYASVREMQNWIEKGKRR